MKQLSLKSIRIDGGTQSRVELNSATVDEYAEAMHEGEAFPPVVVFFDGADYWLADGFHRYFGADHAGLEAIAADVRNGTQADAQLFSFGVNASHGLRRTNADKRKAVTGALQHPVSCKWSDRQIAKHCGVSDKTVSAVRVSIFGNSEDAPPAERTVTRNGTTYTQNTANVGKSKPAQKAAAAPEPTAVPAPAPAAANDVPAKKKAVAHAPAAEPQDSDELHDAVITINELAAENELLRDRVAVAAMHGTDEERAQAAETIAELRAQIKTLEAELDATRASRDGFQRQNAELMKQVRMQQKQIKKLGG